MGVNLSGHALTVTRFGERIRQERYYLAEESDWAYLHSLLKEHGPEQESENGK